MEAAFIVKLDVEDISPAGLSRVAEDISKDLEGSYVVLDVHAWNRQTSAIPVEQNLLLGKPFSASAPNDQ